MRLWLPEAAERPRHHVPYFADTSGDELGIVNSLLYFGISFSFCECPTGTSLNRTNKGVNVCLHSCFEAMCNSINLESIHNRAKKQTIKQGIPPQWNKYAIVTLLLGRQAPRSLKKFVERSMVRRRNVASTQPKAHFYGQQCKVFHSPFHVARCVAIDGCAKESLSCIGEAGAKASCCEINLFEN